MVHTNAPDGPGVMANNQRVQISHCRTLSQADRPDRAGINLGFYNFLKLF